MLSVRFLPEILPGFVVDFTDLWRIMLSDVVVFFFFLFSLCTLALVGKAFLLFYQEHITQLHTSLFPILPLSLLSPTWLRIHKMWKSLLLLLRLLLSKQQSNVPLEEEKALDFLFPHFVVQRWAHEFSLCAQCWTWARQQECLLQEEKETWILCAWGHVEWRNSTYTSVKHLFSSF